MKNGLLTLFSFFIVVPYLNAQVLPGEGRLLNYRLIGFSFPAVQHANDYKLEIAMGNLNYDDSFKKNIISSCNNKTNKIIAEVPSFGKQYTWRIVYTISHSKIITSPLYHFSTGMVPGVDTANTRLRIIKSAVKYPDAYVFADGNKAIYDMSGRVVWYLPKIDEKIDENCVVRDMKLTPQGTITLLANNEACEINYDGIILWKGPNNGIVSGDSMEHYHHEFTRLASGHYMVMGNELINVYVKVNSSGDSSLLLSNKMVSPDSTRMIASKASIGTIIEYDETGKIVWQYRTSKYFTGSDIIYFKWPNRRFDTHDNAFFFDEKNQCVYISFRDISRIIKIKYPEGTLIDTYGEIYKPGVPKIGNGLFCNQHSCKISGNGYLYLFNNNDCHPQASATVIMMEQPGPAKNSLKKIWEFECPGEIVKNGGGGNVIELPDQSLFVSSCNPYSIMFIVAPDKEIIWCALAERWDGTEKKWLPLGQYRASIVTDREELEKLIWHTK